MHQLAEYADVFLGGSGTASSARGRARFLWSWSGPDSLAEIAVANASGFQS